MGQQDVVYISGKSRLRGKAKEKIHTCYDTIVHLQSNQYQERLERERARSISSALLPLKFHFRDEARARASETSSAQKTAKARNV